MTGALKVGTRGSALARWQTDWVCAQLARYGLRTEVVVIKTQGDAEVDRPLYELPGKGFFTKGIEDALLECRIDIAVHSLKDLPTALPEGLVLGAIPERADPADALVSRDPVPSVSGLAPGTRVGTSSLRRVAQLRYLRADLDIRSLRGNVPTRVGKVRTGTDLDAALVAWAGLARLDLADQYTVKLDPFEVMPAPGQGALGLEIRAADPRAQAALAPLGDPAVACAVAAERAVLARLGGGCQAPVAAYVAAADGNGGRRLFGRVTATDGSVQCTASADIAPDDPEAAGHAVANLLRAQGALEFLAR